MSSSEIRVDTIKSRTGLGTVTINSSGLQLTGIITSENRVDVKSYDGTPGRLDLYCESSNVHYARIQAPDHADFSGNVTLTLPNTAGTLLNSDVSGNVGIGTDNPTELLHLSADSAHEILLKRGGGAPSEVRFANEGNLAVISNNTNGIVFETGATPTGAMIIESSGNVGIGTDNPQQLLDIFEDDATDTVVQIRSGTANREKARITKINRTTGNGDLQIQSSSGANNHSIVFLTDSSGEERMHIDGAGNVGVGTSVPTEKLHVLGDARITGILTVGTSSLTIDGDAGTINGIPYATAGALSNRNLIDNGGMRVAQRGTSFTSLMSAYTLDRWYFFDGTSAVFDVAQSSTVPNGFSNSLKVDCTTTGTPTTTQEIYVEHRIEAQNLQHLQYGASGAQSTTLSFWVKSNKTADYGLWIYLPDTAVQYATTYTISSADTWEYKTIVIPGNTANAITNDNGTGLLIRFYLGIGPTNAGTPTETWTADGTNRSPDTNLGDSTSNEWLLSGVQLEVGTQATPFEHRSFADDLKTCERYYEKSFTYSSPPGTATANGCLSHRKTSNSTAYTGFQIRFATRKRATPTVGLYNTNNSTEGQIRSDGANVDANDLNTNEMGFNVNTVVAQGANVIQAMHYTADAEL